MTLPQKRRRRVEILIDGRMLGFLKPTAISGPVAGKRRRDSLEFLSPLCGQEPSSDKRTDKAS